MPLESVAADGTVQPLSNFNNTTLLLLLLLLTTSQQQTRAQQYLHSHLHIRFIAAPTSVHPSIHHDNLSLLFLIVDTWLRLLRIPPTLRHAPDSDITGHAAIILPFHSHLPIALLATRRARTLQPRLALSRIYCWLRAFDFSTC